MEIGRAPFDLASGPLLRGGLWRLEDELHLFFLALHHNIFDEWSQGVLFRELAAAYTAETAGASTRVDLPDLPIQYADYAEWQAAWMQGEAAQAQLAYWKAKLAGAPQVFELPADHPRPAVQTSRGDTRTIRMPVGPLDGLRRLARQEQVTLFTTLLAAFAVLLHRYTSQTDLLIGTPITNRRYPELENLIGFFLNTLALRLDLSGEPTFRTLLRQAGRTVLEAFDNQDLPFERLVEAAPATRF